MRRTTPIGHDTRLSVVDHLDESVGVLALSRLGVVTPRKLRNWRRYAIVVNALIATALPGVDPVSMLLEMLALYELSILLASAFGQPAPRLDSTAPGPAA